MTNSSHEMKKVLTGVIAVTLCAAVWATAIPYSPTYLQPPSPVPQASNPTIEDIADALGVDYADIDAMIGWSLYKAEFGNGGNYIESGDGGLFSSLLASMTPPAGGQNVTLTYTGYEPAPTLSYIIVKDGAAGWTIWDAFGWNGSDDIRVDNRDLWNKPRNALSGISHVEVFGGVPPERDVPDSGVTVLLMGLAGSGLAALRRFLG